MEGLRLMVTSPKIQWEMPLSLLEIFKLERNCKIPYDNMGQKEICRYVKELYGVQIYVTPVFTPNLVALTACFEQGDKLESYTALTAAATAELGPPVYSIKEEWRGTDLGCYPVNIWILQDSIFETGIHEENYVAVGYVKVTQKAKYKTIYTEKYLSRIGWRPPKGL